MKEPQLGDILKVVTNDPDLHDYVDVEVTAIDISRDVVICGELELKFLDHKSTRVPGAAPRSGEWAFGDDRDD